MVVRTLNDDATTVEIRDLSNDEEPQASHSRARATDERCRNGIEVSLQTFPVVCHPNDARENGDVDLAASMPYSVFDEVRDRSTYGWRACMCGSESRRRDRHTPPTGIGTYALDYCVHNAVQFDQLHVKRLTSDPVALDVEEHRGQHERLFGSRPSVCQGFSITRRGRTRNRHRVDRAHGSYQWCSQVMGNRGGNCCPCSGLIFDTIQETDERALDVDDLGWIARMYGGRRRRW